MEADATLRWEQVEALCHAAMACAPDARQAFLDEACGGDADLRREVESLLAREAGAAAFLEVPALAEPAMSRAATAPPSIGRYRILGLLASGGMGDVYRARDTSLGRDVALKVLPAVLAHFPDRLAWLEREARLLAALSHPNILTVHEVGTLDGLSFVVTELLEGETLRSVIARRVLTGDQAIALALQAARGLAAAHGKGIVHRDLKPENLFLTTGGQLKILDFSIARLAEHSRDHATGGLAVIVGTAPYMAPEQARGAPVDARADVFALGVVLYEMLGGSHPFAHPTVAETLEAVQHFEPPDLCAIGPDVSPAAAGIVRRCLEKAPERRFGHARDLANALEGVLHGGEISVHVDRLEARSPYPGLRAFAERDATLFFGREHDVTALREKLRTRSLLAVIGPSGAGKTSLLRAGLLPWCPHGWTAVACTPGTSPLRSLMQALATQLVPDAAAAADRVEAGDDDAAIALLARWKGSHAHALVVIDQFEELFTQNDAHAQGVFARLVGRLSQQPGFHVVLALRDDFLMRCCALPPLAGVLRDLTAVLPPNREALRRALVAPARAVGYGFEDDALVEEMLASVEHTRSPLPLLAFAAACLWEARDERRQVLTRESYEAIGGVAGALARHAEESLARIGADRHRLVRDIFRALVTSNGTRAVVDRSELVEACGGDGAAEDVLEILLEARLLHTVETEDAATGGVRHRVEIVHESLLDAWPRLLRWRTQDEALLQFRDHFRQAAHLWDEKRRSSDLLWAGTAFREFEVWRDRARPALGGVEAAFAAAMVRRHRRIARVRWITLAAALFALSVVTIVVARSRAQAVAAHLDAEASHVAALGRLELDRYPTAAIAFALESLAIADTPEGRLLAVEALWRAPAAVVLPLPTGTDCLRVTFSPDGSRLACAGFSNAVVTWRAAGGPPRVEADLPILGDLREVAFDAASTTLLSWVPGLPLLHTWSVQGGGDRAPLRIDAMWGFPQGHREFIGVGPLSRGSRRQVMRRWSLDDGSVSELVRWDPPREMRMTQPGVRTAAFDRRLQYFAFADGHDVVLRTLGARAEDVRLERHGDRIRELAFDAGGEHLLSCDESGLFCLWAAGDGALLRELRTLTPHRYSRPVFSPDGQRLSWMSGDRAVHVWDLRAPIDAPPATFRRNDIADAGDVSFDPRGRWLASAGVASVALWAIDMPRPTVLTGHVEGPLTDLAFSPDSRLLASCARDGALVWPLGADEGHARRVALGGDYYCYGARFSPDGQHLALNVPHVGTMLVPMDGGPSRVVLDNRAMAVPLSGDYGGALMPLAFDAAGRTLAVAPTFAPTADSMSLQLIDLPSGRTDRVALSAPGARRANGFDAGVYSLRYTADGRLLLGGAGGVRRWEPATGRLEQVLGEPFAYLDADRAGSVVAAAVGTLGPTRQHLFDAEVVVLGADAEVVRRLASHGNSLSPRIAVDPAGRFLVTGDAHGVVRVGPMDEGPPHLLLGHSGPINRIAVSPDGKWIASASGREIRLWPTPDLRRQPLHTLPLPALRETLAQLTNLRVVADPRAETGWVVTVGTSRGWQDVPVW